MGLYKYNHTHNVQQSLNFLTSVVYSTCQPTNMADNQEGKSNKPEESMPKGGCEDRGKGCDKKKGKDGDSDGEGKGHGKSGGRGGHGRGGGPECGERGGKGGHGRGGCNRGDAP